MDSEYLQKRENNIVVPLNLNVPVSGRELHEALNTYIFGLPNEYKIFYFVQKIATKDQMGMASDNPVDHLKFVVGENHEDKIDLKQQYTQVGITDAYWQGVEMDAILISREGYEEHFKTVAETLERILNK